MSFFGEIYADPDLPHRARTVYMYLRDHASCTSNLYIITNEVK